MGNQRLLLYFPLFFILDMSWAPWQLDYGPNPDAATTPSYRINGEVNPIEVVRKAAAYSQETKTPNTLSIIHLNTGLI